MTDPTDRAVSRRSFLAASALGVGTLALAGSLWRSAAAPAVGPLVGRHAAPATRAVGPYGPLLPADEQGIALPAGFTSRIVARSGEPVGPTSYRWHPAPDGGACFPDGDGWVYVSNSEVAGTGGASAVRFAPDATVTDAYRILDGTDRNCAGGATPWGTWLSCEEVSRGQVYETDPYGRRRARVRPAMGRFNHEAAAVDPVRKVVYLTEDDADGCLYRFRPSTWPDLAAGTLEVLCADGERLAWTRVPDPAAHERETRFQVPEALRFDGGEGAWYSAGACWFTTKGDNRVWCYAAGTERLSVVYDATAPINGVDNLTVAGRDDLFVAEDGGDMRICTIMDGTAAPFLGISGQEDSEITGPAFSPDGTRLYFSSQRGTGGEDGDGITYEVLGPFHAGS